MLGTSGRKELIAQSSTSNSVNIYAETLNIYGGLTYFMPLISFDTPWKYQIARGATKRDRWHEMD